MDATSLVGEVVLGEHKLDALVREDDAIAVFASTSTVDGGQYVVVLAKRVDVDTASTALESAVERCGRHAVGVRGLITLLHARTWEGGGGHPDQAIGRLAVVRRGEPYLPISGWIAEGSRSAAEVARILAPVGEALIALHDQGLLHGAVSSSSVVLRGEQAALDLFGLAAAADAASGARGSRDVLPPEYQAPELAGDAPQTPGPWTDTYSFALLAAELLTGRARARFCVGDGEAPTPRALGAAVPDRVEELFRLALARSPSPRPTVERFLRDLGSFASDPLVAPAARPSASSPVLHSPATVASPAGIPDVPAGRPVAPVRQPPPPLRAPSSASSGNSSVLAWSLAAGLLLFGIAMSGTLFYVLRQGSLAPSTAGSTPSAPPTPPAAPSPAPSASAGVGPSRITGTPTYPADQSALVPLELDDGVRGDRDALVTLVLFGDLTCPFTARAIAGLPALESRYGSELRIVFKHFPVSGTKQDTSATDAAEVATLALRQVGREAFWKVIMGASQRPGRLDAGGLEELGIHVGLKAGEVTDALAKHPDRARVGRDLDLGHRLGLRGTPVIIFNGRKLDGLMSEEVLTKFLDAELRRTRLELGRGTPRDRLYSARVLANVTTSEGEKPPTAPTSY